MDVEVAGSIPASPWGVVQWQNATLGSIPTNFVAIGMQVDFALAF